MSLHNCDVCGIKWTLHHADPCLCDYEVLAEKNRAHLRAAVASGCYSTERDSLFYQHYSPADNKLSGELLLVDQGTSCQIVRTSGGSILVKVNHRKKNWFAWIHS